MSYYISLALILFVYMSFCFVVSLIRKRNDIADVAWGIGFILISWSAFFLSENFGNLALLANILVSVWGARLAWHIYNRNKGKSEDYRYLAWRKEWGQWFYLRSYFQVYLLQGLFLFLIASPLMIINNNPGARINLIDFFGISIWLPGFLFEVIGDAQLKKFISNPANKGKLMQEGLWKYSRHPNYFGEVTQWWALWLIALSLPNGWLSIIGPLTITILILKISGIPLLEKKMISNPEFAEYRKKTSMFIPLPQKK